MSKIGEKIITIEEGVQVEVQGHKVKVSGKDGQIEIEVPKELTVELVDKVLAVKRKRDDKRSKSLHGLIRSLLANAVSGVVKPWEKNLEVVGTGFNVKMQGEELEFKLGYSHPVIFKPIGGIKFKIEGNNKVTVFGADKQLVGQVAYQIKQVRKPDVYKGKGIKYEGERLRIKPGKKAKTATA